MPAGELQLRHRQQRFITAGQPAAVHPLQQTKLTGAGRTEPEADDRNADWHEILESRLIAVQHRNLAVRVDKGLGRRITGHIDVDIEVIRRDI